MLGAGVTQRLEPPFTSFDGDEYAVLALVERRSAPLPAHDAERPALGSLAVLLVVYLLVVGAALELAACT
jgi:hypothetical protein